MLDIIEPLRLRTVIIFFCLGSLVTGSLLLALSYFLDWLDSRRVHRMLTRNRNTDDTLQ